MAKLVWDKVGEHFYETGVDHGVLFVMNNSTYAPGVAWNGLVSVTESPSGAEPNAMYADNIKYLEIMSAEEFGGTIEAFTYPDEFLTCDGIYEPIKGIAIGQQARSRFALAYRTKLGNDVSQDFGYKIHILYNLLAKPSEKQYQTINDSPEAITFSWELSSIPVPITGKRPVSSITVSSVGTDQAKLAAFEKILYGSDDTPGSAPRLPLPDEVVTLLKTP